MSAATVLLFESVGQLMARPLSHVREVSRPGLLTRLPRAPFGCLGTINLRGELVPVLSLGTLVGLALPPRGDAVEQALVTGHLVVCEDAKAPVGLLVDRVLDLKESELETLAVGSPTLGSRSSELLTGGLRVNGRTAWVLAPEGLVRPARRRLLERAVRPGPHA